MTAESIKHNFPYIWTRNLLKYNPGLTSKGKRIYQLP